MGRCFLRPLALGLVLLLAAAAPVLGASQARQAPPPAWTMAWAVNDRGQVVGWSGLVYGDYRAVRW